MQPVEKCDPVLGEQVRQHLLSVGLETPMVYDRVKADQKTKINNIASHFTAIMEELGLDLTDDSLCDTPNRVAKMYAREIFFGLDYDNFPKCTRIENKLGQTDSFVLERKINVQSNCEHHFVVIDGKATVAYIPKKTILGLSKLNRIVQFFAKRPQVQERLTEQIAETISFITGSPDVAVYIDGAHYCVKSRGIQDVTSTTMTLATRGAFAEMNSELRREFLNSARMA